MRPTAIRAGNIDLWDEHGQKVVTSHMALLLEFDSVDELQRALAERSIDHFDLFREPVASPTATHGGQPE